MIESLIAWSIRHRLAVLLSAVLVLAVGYASLQELSIEAFPDPTETQVNVITAVPGQPAEELERQVSIPIERVVNGMPGLARVRAINAFRSRNQACRSLPIFRAIPAASHVM